MGAHDLYRTGDADAPSQIKDRNGAVALDMCRRCGKAEGDLVSGNCHPPRAGELLAAAAKTYLERNALYGNNYHQHGAVMQALFPEGLCLLTRQDHNRFGILTQLVTKLTRYTANFTKGGHRDSLHDLQVYSAMLEELDLLP